MAVADLTLEGLVHDLNNVFQTIAESAELLEDDPKWEKLAHTLQRSAGRGHRIAHSILETNRSAIELAPIIENASQFCQDYLECANGPKIDFSSEIDAEFRLKGDAAGWERVFVNLFLNAAEAGGKVVRVVAGGDEITICDDGPGVEPALLPTIFQPHVSTKPILSGLGLYVVRSIVEENGGTVTAANAADGGAVFQIRLTRE